MAEHHQQGAVARFAILTADEQTEKFPESAAKGTSLPSNAPIIQPEKKELKTTLIEQSDHPGSRKQDLASDQQPPEKPDPLLGTVLDGRFEILAVLGTGGMSVVYKARQLAVDRLVAIKTLHIQLQTKPGAVERFRREIKSLCMLNSPNIVTVYDCVFSEDGQPFVVMDYLQGMSLEQLIKIEGAIKPERAQKFFLQITSALEHAHKNGVIHRDLKPSNVMIVSDTDEFVKVVDFGLAKLGEDNVKLTKSGEVWGSPPYMSPEQWRSEPCDARSDIYALGTLMYETLTGRDAFPAETLYQFLHKHLHETPPDFHTANPDVDIPPAFERIVFKTLAKDPEQRFQSMTELKAALLMALSSSSRQTVAPPEWKSAGLPISQVNVMMAAGVVAAIAVALTTTLWLQKNFYTTRQVNTPPPHVMQPPPTTAVSAPNTPPATHPIVKPKSTATHTEPSTPHHHHQPVVHATTREQRLRRAVAPPMKFKPPSNNVWSDLRNSHT